MTRALVKFLRLLLRNPWQNRPRQKKVKGALVPKRIPAVRACLLAPDCLIGQQHDDSRRLRRHEGHSFAETQPERRELGGLFWDDRRERTTIVLVRNNVVYVQIGVVMNQRDCLIRSGRRFVQQKRKRRGSEIQR